jgi:hypothetical protein
MSVKQMHARSMTYDVWENLSTHEISQETGAGKHSSKDKIRESVNVGIAHERAFRILILFQFEVGARYEDAEHENQQNVIKTVHKLASVRPGIKVHDHDKNPDRH